MVLEYILVAYAGVFLIYFNLISEEYKKEVISATMVATVISVKVKKWTFKSLGFGLEKFWQSLFWYACSVPVGIGVLYVYATYYQTSWGASQSTLIQYSIGVVIIQELLFRGFLWKLGIQIFGNGTINILVNTIVFASMHVVYPNFWDQYLWLLLTCAGALFATLYHLYPKMYLIIPVHIILNATAVHVGIFH